MNLIIERAEATAAEAKVEIVERKGLGHPDTICDAVMESVSQALCREYLSHFGHILHYNCDKGMLAAGRVETRFGGGRVLEPMRLIIGDRATSDFGGEQIDVSGVAVKAARAWIAANLPHVDPQEHVLYQVELRPGSAELSGIFARPARTLGANDTSAAVGFAPLSPTESLVRETERHLNSSAFKREFPESGQDVKVMGVRQGAQLDLTVAMPLLDRYVESENNYFERKRVILVAALEYLQQRRGGLSDVHVHLNALDQAGTGLAGVYVSVLGTSAEQADSGQVGRGNDIHGLISMCRPRSSEAAPGKNPVSHVGKIYGHLAFQLADAVQTRVEGVSEATIWLVSRIGDPVDQPRTIYAQLRAARQGAVSRLEAPVRRVVEEELARLPDLCARLAGVTPGGASTSGV
jgi:S-adenosylmethionine synthetase